MFRLSHYCGLVVQYLHRLCVLTLGLQLVVTLWQVVEPKEVELHQRK